VKSILRWFRDYLNGRTFDDKELNRDIAEVFSTPVGRKVLNYLIENHMINVAHGDARDPGRAQILIGRHLVVYDLVARIDAHQHPTKYQVGVEQVLNDIDEVEVHT
jgi:hypothetical protein